MTQNINNKHDLISFIRDNKNIVKKKIDMHMKKQRMLEIAWHGFFFIILGFILYGSTITTPTKGVVFNIIGLLSFDMFRNTQSKMYTKHNILHNALYRLDILLVKTQCMDCAYMLDSQKQEKFSCALTEMYQILYTI